MFSDLLVVSDDSNEPVPVLARVRTYPDLRKAIAGRRKALGLPQLLVDELAGLPMGYLGKIEARVRYFGDVSLETVLATLGLEILLIPTELPPMVQRFLLECGKSPNRAGVQSGAHIKGNEDGK